MKRRNERNKLIKLHEKLYIVWALFFGIYCCVIFPEKVHIALLFNCLQGKVLRSMVRIINRAAFFLLSSCNFFSPNYCPDNFHLKVDLTLMRSLPSGNFQRSLDLALTRSHLTLVPRPTLGTERGEAVMN